ncbi:MAG: hypothetical protein JWM14_2551 [Chitinophagaceae bacterium]|nr:hypothetical protein [Chitinophagaceae bacterium]
MTENTLHENPLKASTLFLFALFIGSTFCSILCLDETKITEGILVGSCGLAFLLLTIWSNRSYFYPVVVGFFFYTVFIGTLIYFFPKIVMEGVGILSPYIYLMLGFLAFIYLISYEYKKKQSTVTAKK